MRALLISLFCILPVIIDAEMHTFTDVKGRKIEGELLSIANGKIRIRRVDGIVFDIPWRQLSKADLFYCKDEQKKLGVTADKLDKDTLLNNMKSEMSVDFNVTLPSMNMFFVQRESDYMKTSYREDKKAAGKTKRYLKDYKKFLEEFFGMSNPSLSIKSHTFTYSKPLYIVTDAVPKISQMELNSLDVLKYLSNDKAKSLGRAVIYFNEKPEVLDQAISVLKKYSKLSENGIAGEKELYSVHINSLMKKGIAGLTELRTNRILNRAAIRDFTLLVRELDLGKD